MKRAWIILLAALFVAPLVLAEEAFFEEASFDTGVNAAGDETFFEESGFFAEDDFFGEVTEEAALPEEPAEDGLEERTVLAMKDTTDEGSYLFAGTPAEILPHLLTPSVVDAKPNEVRLDWEHFYRYGDYYTGGNPEAVKSVKLPAGTAYYVYERSKTHFGVWHQVAKTTKRTVTLKNQIGGTHEYFVRLEYTGKGGEQYGNRSNVVLQDIRDVGMWKTFSQVSLAQRPTSFGSASHYDPIIRIRSKEPADAATLTFTVKYESGKTLDWPVDYTHIWPYWDYLGAAGGYEYEAEINLNDSYFTKYTSGDILLRGGTDKAKSITVKITPAQQIGISEYIDGKTKTAKLNKIYFDPDAGKAKPVIEWAYQRGLELQFAVTFPADGVPYGIWDGNEYLGTYYRNSSDPNPMIFPSGYYYHFDLAKDAKSGGHKITVAQLDWTGAKPKAAGEKATYTLNVPAPAAAPVTIGNDLTYSSGKVSGTFWNNNPKASDFEIKIYADNGALQKTDWVPVKSPSLAATGAGYDDYPFSCTVSGPGPFRVIIRTEVLNPKTYVVDKEFFSDVYLTDGTVIPRK